MRGSVIRGVGPACLLLTGTSRHPSVTIPYSRTIFSMAGEIHPHTGLAITGDTELVARRLSIEPVRNEPPPVVLPCVCPLGTHLNTPALCIPD